MAQTTVGVGSALARKLFSVALFAETQRQPGFRGNLTGPAPKQKGAEAKAKGQTAPGYPIIRVTDLSKTAGDTISVDLFNIIQGKPTMGDKKISGKMMDLTYSSQDISINQCRGGVDPGGRMTQQRTLHDLRSMAKAHLAGWNARLEDQTTLVHAAGARGWDQGADWVVPLTTDPDYADIMVNTVTPPTRNRRFFAGGGTSATALAATDVLKLSDIDDLRAAIDDMVFPMQPIRLQGDMEANENPLYVLYISSRQWNDLQQATGATEWRTMLANAHARSAGFKHPLFMGTPGYWNGILIKKMWRPIRFFGANETGYVVGANQVPELDATDAVVNVTLDADTVMDRALCFGAQALATAYGKHNKSESYYSWHEEESDHGNTMEVSTASMSGKAKLRFTGSDGALTDHGVITLDSAISVAA